jgi:hypothetical protein
MGRLVVDDEAVEVVGLPASCGVEDVGFCAMVGTFALDLRLEPNPKLLNREFIELIRPGGVYSMREGRKKTQTGKKLRLAWAWARP